MTTHSDSLSAFKILTDVDASAAEARPTARAVFSPVVFLQALHKRGWMITANPDHVVNAEFEEVEVRAIQESKTT